MSNESVHGRMRLPVTLHVGRTQRRLAGAGLLVITAILVFAGSTLGAFKIGQVTSALIFALAISGLNLVAGYGGMLSIGHSAFMGIGAYTTAIMIVHYRIAPVATIPVAVVICFVGGLIVGGAVSRVKGLYLALVTLAVAVAFPELIRRFESFTGGSLGIVIRASDLQPPTWSGFARTERAQWLYWVTVVLLLVVLLLIYNFSRSRRGLAVVAVRDNEIAAVGCGINRVRSRVVLFGLSAAITGLGGSLYAMYLAALSPDASFTVLTSIQLLTGMILGGVGTVLGPVLGGFAIIYIPYFIADTISGQAFGLVFGAILILAVFILPRGIIGLLSTLRERLILVTPIDSHEHRPDPEMPHPKRTIADTTSHTSVPIEGAHQ